MRLENKVAIITGASRGIGRELAVAFAQEGADVVIAARSVEKGTVIPFPGTIHETAEAVRALGRRALPLKVDILVDADVVKMVNRTLEEFGRIDVLVNNAGLIANAEFQDMSMEEWDRLMDTNVRGAVLCTHAVLPVMIKQERGNIINISSATVRTPSPSLIAYGASKVAIEYFSAALAAGVKKYNIAVNVLSPDAAVDTKLLLDYGHQFINPDSMVPPTCLNEPAVVLATQDASGITGKRLSMRTFGTEWP